MDSKECLLGCFLLLVILLGVNGKLPSLECPEECDCHYFRINWVTDCSESNLTDIPTHEHGLSLNVYVLNMNGNLLKNVTPFPHDIKLRRLQLADNRLTKITREEFADLVYLLDLDLSGNEITTIDPEAFRDSHGLITLELQMNPLQPIEGPLLVSPSLMHLDLSDCQLSKLTPTFFQNVTALNKLDLSGNPLGILESEVLGPLNSLEELKLNRCKLTHISGTAFAKNENMKMLELSENDLKGPIDWIQVLGGLSVLEHLDLRRTGISKLPEHVFGNNTWLRSLVLAENELVDLDVATTLGHNLRHLFTLDLSNCHLNGPLSEDAFTNETNLRTLLLSGNHMSAADLAVALAPLTKLQKLTLKNCSLSRLPSNTFHRFTCLHELDISNNPLNDAFTALLSPLETLERLDMGYSNLAHISKTTFSKMTSLKSLILSGNPLSNLEYGLFQNLTHLESLELNYCGLSSLNATVFPDNFTYPDLEELHLAGNPLQVPESGPLLPRQLSRLRTLDLSDCNLTFIPPDALTSFQNITQLLLSGNKITSSENTFDFLKNLPHLESLDLSRNKLTHISPQIFSSHHEIHAIRLAENPWVCGCHIADLWEWAVAVKRDIGVLIGSTTLVEETVIGARKRNKGLFCHFDSRTSPIHKDIQSKKKGRRDFIDNVKRSWARYVRESGCDSSKRLQPARLLTNRHIRDLRRQVQPDKVKVNEFAIDWLMTVVGLSTVVLVVSALLVAIALFREKRRKSGTSPGRDTDNSEDLHEDSSSSNYYVSGSERNLRRLTKRNNED
ncbi:uncharacterized protein LOC142334011 isoform X2 [Lycorma delicatula]|uniref:uncharacterized protein LOC142334011 isoform X2 n=1 Tax=Lycorma delicatula TaxID=130591 RepID=UPI003F51A2F0